MTLNDIKMQKSFLKRTTETKKVYRNRTVTLNNVTVRGEVPYLSETPCYQSLFLQKVNQQMTMILSLSQPQIC